MVGDAGIGKTNRKNLIYDLLQGDLLIVRGQRWENWWFHYTRDMPVIFTENEECHRHS